MTNNLKTEIKERPVLFSAPMVRAILEERKTQTRRVIKSPAKNMQKQGHEVIRRNPDNDSWYRDRIWSMRMDGGSWGDFTHERFLSFCPHGKVGDRLWVRETFWPALPLNFDVKYKADKPQAKNYDEWAAGGDMWMHDVKWKPAIYMPRSLSRINLEITNISVERLQDISEEDAIAEGAQITDEWTGCSEDIDSHKQAYEFLWESINGKGSWDVNPWVWKIEFKRI